MQQLTTTESKKVRLALFGPSNSCLTYNALRIAQGICGDWSKVAIIESSGCAHKFHHLGMFTSIGMTAPFSPERYFDAMNICETAGIEVIILNSISPEYAGVGGLLEKIDGDFEFALRAHRAFLMGIRQSEAHVISTVNTRSRLTMKGSGRLTISQQPVQQPGIEKVFQTVLQLDRSSRATVLKDETGTLPQKAPFPLDTEVGAQLQRWCCSHGQVVNDTLQWKINGCCTLPELYELLFECDTDDPKVMAAFTKRRLQLEGVREASRELMDAPF